MYATRRLALALSMAFVAPSTPAAATPAPCSAAGFCQCVPAERLGLTEADLVLRQRDRAAAVFAGTVVRVDTLPERSGPQAGGRGAGGGPVVARLRVEEIWTGPGHDTATVAFHLSPALRHSCDLRLEVGERYLVFASAAGGLLWTRQCQGTLPLDLAGSTLGTLGAGRPPRP